MDRLPILRISLAVVIAVGIGARAQHVRAQKQGGDVLDLAATSVNVASPGTPVTIRIFRWSTDQERAALVKALTSPPPSPARPIPGARGGARGARPGGAGAAGAPARGGAAAGAARGGAAAGAARGGAAGAARGAGGQAARGGAGAAAGGRRGRGGLVQAPQTPIDVFTDAVQKAMTLGYVWTNDVTGYAIRYAWHMPAQGGDHIVLVTDRRLDEYAPEWKPKDGGTAPDYGFTLIDIRMTAAGTGTAKTSLTSAITGDAQTNTLGLEDVASAPVLLRNIRHYKVPATE
jgi:hypothetical protein